MHDWPLDKDPRWCWIRSAAHATRRLHGATNYEGLWRPRNKNEIQKKTLVKDVRTLSSEQTNEPRAISTLHHTYWAWDWRRVPRTFSLQRERKTQSSIKQQKKDDECWMNDYPNKKDQAEGFSTCQSGAPERYCSLWVSLQNPNQISASY